MTRTPSPDSRHRPPTDGAQPDQTGGSAGDFPRAEPLIRDAAVAVHRSGPHVGVGGDHLSGGGEEQGERHLGDRIRVAARGVQHRDSGFGRAGDVDVVGITAGRNDSPQPSSRTGPLTESLSTTTISAHSA